MKYVIVGGEIPGVEAAKEIRKHDKKSEITIIDKEMYLSYLKAAMPYYISGMIEKEDLILDTKESLKENYNIEAKLEAEVLEIIPDDKILKVLDRKSSNIFSLKYDKLIISLNTLARKLKVFEGLRRKYFHTSQYEKL